MADEIEQTILRGLIDRRVEVEGPDFDQADESLTGYAKAVAAALVAAGYRRKADVLREAYWALRGHAASYRAVSADTRQRLARDADNASRRLAVDEWYARGIEAAARDIAEALGVPEHEIAEPEPAR